jgi:hypothetical protein
MGLLYLCVWLWVMTGTPPPLYEQAVSVPKPSCFLPQLQVELVLLALPYIRMG